MNKKTTEAALQKQIEARRAEAKSNEQMTSHRFFLGYLCDRFRRTPLYTHWQNLLTYFRRFRMITYLFRALRFLLTLLEAGALVLVSVAVFFILLPIGLALLFGLLLTACLESRKTNRLLQEYTAGKPMYVLFMNELCRGVFWENARAFAANGGAVFVVSPYWISSKGLKKRGFYCTARSNGDGVYLVRRYYFFSLKKRVLDRGKTTYLY